MRASTLPGMVVLDPFHKMIERISTDNRAVVMEPWSVLSAQEL